MKAIADLLDGLVFTPSRNAKLRLIGEGGDGFLALTVYAPDTSAFLDAASRHFSEWSPDR